MEPEVLAAVATGREEDLFLADLNRLRGEIENTIRDRRVLVIGGAGSIGSATTALLSDFRPEALHVIDQNENSLAELVRDLRSRPTGLPVPDFRALPVDFGSPIMHRFLQGERPYDLVLNFAALKHVRSEKDACSTLQMLETNLVKPLKCWRWLRETGSTASYFNVSTDKAANPVNIMGASKRIMEQLMVARPGAIAPGTRATSARFANVAFSDGSLLHSFVQRFRKRQPLVCPRETRRFFISLREAGQICVIASICGPSRHVVFPRLDPYKDSRRLDEIAVAFLRRQGFEPEIYEKEDECRARFSQDVARNRYPLLLTALDTAGEKPSEEFVAEGEEIVDFGMSSLLALRYQPAPVGALSHFIEEIECLIACPHAGLTKERLVGMIQSVAPEFRHLESTHTLDQKM